MPFPLDRLPDPALKHILHCMTPLELLAISVLSTKLSGIVKSLEIRAEYLEIKLEGSVTVEGTFQNGYLYISFPNVGLNGLDGTPRNIEILDRFDNVDLEWTSPGAKLRTFLKCISQNFDWYLDGIKLRFCTKHEVLNIETLSKCFVSVTDTVIEPPCSVEYAQKILKYFRPVTKNIQIYDSLFREPSSSLVQSFLILNHDNLRIPDIRHATLDNLLSINAESIIICRPNFTHIGVNRFIKLWIKGGNPRLKKLEIRHNMENEIYDRNVVMKGFPHQKVGKHVEREFMEERTWGEVIKGGNDIRSRNGRRATFLTKKMGNERRILFLVWD